MTPHKALVGLVGCVSKMVIAWLTNVLEGVLNVVM